MSDPWKKKRPAIGTALHAPRKPWLVAEDRERTAEPREVRWTPPRASRPAPVTGAGGNEE